MIKPKKKTNQHYVYYESATGDRSYHRSKSGVKLQLSELSAREYVMRSNQALHRDQTGLWKSEAVSDET